jgi:rhodanese-related sulfurtransferase
MSQSTTPNPILTFLSPIVNVPREIWKHLVNILRGVKDISPKEAQVFIQHKKAFILDVREQHEYDAGHVANSILIPLGQLNERVAELEKLKASDLVVICRGGKRSATACWQLGQQGFSKVYNIAGGIIAWRKAELPVVQ